MGFLSNIGPIELLVIVLVVLVLFGKRLPELGTGLGKAISNFRRSYKDGGADPLPGSEKSRLDDKK